MRYGQLFALLLERCNSYYRRLWMKFGKDEKLLLIHLAQDSFVSHAARPTVEALLREGILVREPSLRLFNDTFRSSVAGMQSEAEVKELESGYALSAWARLRLPILLLLAGILCFLYLTQPSVLSGSIAIITTLVTLIPTALKLITLLRGEKSDTSGAV